MHRLPYEVWEIILDLLDQRSLLNFQRTCQEIRDVIIAYAISGRLKSRALVLNRLTYQGDGYEARRGKVDGLKIKLIRLTQGWSFLLLGVGVYGGLEEELLDPESIVTFDRSTTSLKIFSEKSIVAIKERVLSTEEAKVAVQTRNKEFPRHTLPLFLDEPLEIKLRESVGISLNIMPTDVKNHYSGWPITTLGAELWTCYGVSPGDTLRESPISGMSFEIQFSNEEFFSNRSCLREGQLPYLIAWVFPV